MNSIILRDTNLLPLVNEVSKEFVRYTYTSLINFFSKYN